MPTYATCLRKGSLMGGIIPQLIVNSLITGSLYALAASGLALSYGLLKIFNFAHGHFMMLGAYFFLFASVELKQHLFISLCFALCLAGLVSFSFLRIIVVKLIPYGITLVLAASLAFAILLESCVSLLFGVNVRSIPTPLPVESLEFFGVFITPLQILLLCSSAALTLLLAYVIHSTPAGRRLRALSQNEHAARALGVSQQSIQTIVFLLASSLAVLAGIFVGFEGNLQPYMGSSYTIKAFAAVVLGSIGNIWGALLGSYLLAFVENFSIGIDFWGHSLPASYRDALAYLVILLVLLTRPQGLMHSAARRV